MIAIFMAKVAPLIGCADSGEAASTAPEVISSVDRDRKPSHGASCPHTISSCLNGDDQHLGKSLFSHAAL